MIPVDYKRCQAEKPNGASFMSLGAVPRLVRCNNKPVVVATERKPADDGLQGSMSLCKDCWQVLQDTMPEMAIYNIIEETDDR